MSTAAERLSIIFKMPKNQRKRKRYTDADITKEALEKWAVENGKSRKQIWRRRYNIKKHMRLRDAKEAKVAEAATDVATVGAVGGSGAAVAGTTATPGSPRADKNSYQRPLDPTIPNKSAQKETGEQELRVKKKKKKRKKKKHTVSHQLDYNNPQSPWDSRNYLQMVANEYGGPCGDMHLLDDSIIPYDMLL